MYVDCSPLQHHLAGESGTYVGVQIFMMCAWIIQLSQCLCSSWPCEYQCSRFTPPLKIIGAFPLSYTLKFFHVTSRLQTIYVGRPRLVWVQCVRATHPSPRMIILSEYKLSSVWRVFHKMSYCSSFAGSIRKFMIIPWDDSVLILCCHVAYTGEGRDD